MRDTTRRRIIAYLALTFGLSSIFYALIVAKGMDAYNGLFAKRPPVIRPIRSTPLLMFQPSRALK